ncbi:phosphate regulon transcriptional regulatory protein PhoB [Rhodoferax lithotrophicus]|uniref:Phosphate regulon transcriptional regulatory protein PhoB n=1 Tax=Rhodoferax lithotrophicus TaxID=2798804 RepID=A0ABN6D219_9BURK|nr:response regulator [Rhodoferax sp. MIZ03]BCO26032.1 phosphate regulon transcriptional regulatory protein PhoB [Rhodoferax sp. MIZ03]
MAIQNVLIVDDSKTELMFLTDVLHKHGMSVRTAENSEETMQRLVDEKPDLILMDVVMPGQNGFQLTRSINRNPLYSDIPIIMCTSKNLETDRVWGMRQGAKDYITKPVSPAELMEKIRALG